MEFDFEAVTAGIRYALANGVEIQYLGLHPADWEALRFAQAKNGEYLVSPYKRPSLQGLPIVVSVLFPEGRPILVPVGPDA